MSFSSFSFLLFFLPLFPVYALLPKRWRDPVLLLASLGFYAWGEPRYVLLLLASIAVTYLFGRAMRPERSRGARKALLIAALCFHIGLLVVFKYAAFFFGSFLTLPKLSLPLGISFYTFHAMSYLIDVYRQTSAPAKSPLRLALYLAMFPKLIMGPIVPYHEMERALDDHPLSPELTAAGCFRFAVGLAKKALLADAIGAVISPIWSDTASLTVLSAWLGLIGYALQLYFDFSGYSDMAIGLGAMLGFRLPENFRYPYLCTSISDFWRRWHISLGGWFRDYLYIPLGGSRAGTLRTIRNLMIVWLATGLWHGASWNSVLWGVYFGVLIVLEKLLKPRVHAGRPGAALYRILCVFLVLMGWVLFRAATLPAAGQYFRALFGGAARISPQARVYLHDNWLLLLVGCIGATPLAATLAKRLSAKLRPGALAIARTVLMLALLALSLLWLVNNTFQGFVYFKF